MGQEITNVKKRIKSVSSAHKVTGAMKLVSTVKLKKWKNKMIANKEYTEQLEEVKNTILLCAKDLESPYFSRHKEGKKLYVIVSSTLGLCGAYNTNIFKLANANVKEEDAAIILGGKGIAHFENGQFTIVEDFNEYTSVQDDQVVNSLTNYLMNKFISKEYSEIHLIYSEYKNSLVFIPRDFKLLPLEQKEGKEVLQQPILEPNTQELVNTLIPIYLKTTILAKLLESEVCEHAARSNAMENATKNAEELLSDLQIQFNKARQSAITQEIIEIVGAAQAL